MGKYTEADIIEGTRRILKNGMLAGKVQTENGQRFRIIGVQDRAALRKSSARRRSGSRKALSKRAATRAFNSHYKKAKYKTERGRKSARSRDLCWDNQEKVGDVRYRRSPHRYDYQGVDDGSDSSCGGVHQYKEGAKLNHMKKGSQEAREWREKMVAAKRAKSSRKAKRGGQSGGSRKPVSLQTAVRLLRQYYTEKYA